MMARKSQAMLSVLSTLSIYGIFIFYSGLSLAAADLRPEKVHVADSKKNQVYVRDGLIIGGDRAIDDVVIKDIRRADNKGFERIVIDLAGVKQGEPSAVPRPPYYQIAVTPDERRLIFSIWGKPKLSFNAEKVKSAFKRSSIIQKPVLLPRLEEDSWTFAFEMKSEASVEVFELSNPVRVIVDIQRVKKLNKKNNI